jgi:hypothetical protein
MGEICEEDTDLETVLNKFGEKRLLLAAGLSLLRYFTASRPYES